MFVRHPLIPFFYGKNSTMIDRKMTERCKWKIAEIWKNGVLKMLKISK
jgi:hypothetical protein